jgi:hypothetical protein
VRPLPRYVLAIMAGFVVFELWIPLLAIILRALVGPTIPTAVQAVVPLFGLAVPTVVALGLSDYLADRRGLVRPYEPKRRVADEDEDLGDEDQDLDEDEDAWDEDEDEITDGHERPNGDTESAADWREGEEGEPGGKPHDRRDGEEREVGEPAERADGAAGPRSSDGAQARDPERPGRG